MMGLDRVVLCTGQVISRRFRTDDRQYVSANGVGTTSNAASVFSALLITQGSSDRQICDEPTVPFASHARLSYHPPS
jgi:hypothetical protein